MGKVQELETWLLLTYYSSNTVSDFIFVAKLDIAIVGEGFTPARLLDSILIYLIRLNNRLNCLKVLP